MERRHPPAATASARLPLLDGLRTVAAIGVVLYHWPALFGVPRMFSRTYLFVDLFFLLSGFVLTLSIEPKMAAGMNPSGFMRARIRRLWPMMALGTLAGAAAFATQTNPVQTLWLLLLGLLFIPLTGGGGAIYPLNAPQWSLFWELVANIFHALLLRKLSDRALLLLAAAAGFCLVVAIHHAGSNATGANAHQWWLAAPRIAWSYVLGSWLARKWRATRPRPLAGWLWALFLPLGALIALPVLPLGHAMGDALTVIVVLPALFWVAVCAVPPLAAMPVLERIGALSYPIYALHLPVMFAFSFVQKSWTSSLLSVISALLLAELVVRIAPRVRSWLHDLGPGACSNIVDERRASS